MAGAAAGATAGGAAAGAAVGAAAGVAAGDEAAWNGLEAFGLVRPRALRCSRRSLFCFRRAERREASVPSLAVAVSRPRSLGSDVAAVAAVLGVDDMDVVFLGRKGPGRFSEVLGKLVHQNRALHFGMGSAILLQSHSIE